MTFGGETGLGGGGGGAGGSPFLNSAVANTACMCSVEIRPKGMSKLSMNSTQGKGAQIGKRYHRHGWVSIENFAQNFLGFEMEKAWGVFFGWRVGGVRL